MSVATTFLARMLAESCKDADELAEEFVRNDQRLAEGRPHGKAIAEALHREAARRQQEKQT